MKNLKIIFEEYNKIIDKLVEINGFVENKSVKENFILLQIRDGSCFRSINAICCEENFKNNDSFKKILKLRRGEAVLLRGKIINLYKKEIELIVGYMELNGEIKEKINDIDLLIKHPHLRLRTKKYQAVTMVNSLIRYEIYNYFNKLGFLNIKINEEKNLEGNLIEDVNKGNKRFLIEKFAGSFEKVFLFNDKSDLIEIMISYANLKDIMEYMELFLKYLSTKLLEKCPDIIKYFDENYEENLLKKLELVKNIRNNFIKKSYNDCLKFLNKEIECGNIHINKDKGVTIMENGDLILKDKLIFGDKIDNKIKRYMVGEFGNKPFFVTYNPRHKKNFFMKENSENEDLVDMVSLIVPIIGELMIGSVQNNNLSNNLGKEEMEKADWYLNIKNNGIVQNGYICINYNKLISFLLGIPVKDIIQMNI